MYRELLVDPQIEICSTCSDGMQEMCHELIEVFDFGAIKEAIFDTYDTFGFYVELISYPGDSITEVYNNMV